MLAFFAAFGIFVRVKRGRGIRQRSDNRTFGNGATGITAAARSYFGKTPAEMNLAECAVIASLPYAPSALNPYENPEGCKKRQHLVLDTMVKRGFIGETVANAAKEKTIYLADGTEL